MSVQHWVNPIFMSMGGPQAHVNSKLLPARRTCRLSTAHWPLSSGASTIGSGLKENLRESLLSTSDNTSLANYSHDYELVDGMRVFPSERRTGPLLAPAGLIPMVLCSPRLCRWRKCSSSF